MGPTTDETKPPGSLGRYRLLAEVGAGGMGKVYRAYDTVLDRTVAVKLPLFTGTPEQRAKRVQRFQREAQAAAQVLHPHVCAIFDVAEQDGQSFVVMAYLEGPSLAQRLAAGRFENIAEAVHVVEELLGALAAIHARHVIHRDLKPANILFDAAGRAVLTDFGLARPEEATPLTSEGAIVGTPAYMAPEQAAGQVDRIGPCTDLYSLGVVFYQMVTGRLPFAGSPLVVMHHIIHEEPPPPTRFRPDLDPALEATILRALRKDPRERFRDAAEFAAALTNRSAALPTPPVPAKAPQPRDSRPALVYTVVRLLTWIAGGLLIAAMAGFLSLFCYLAAHGNLWEDGPLKVWVTIIISSVTLLVAFLGVYLWARVEFLHVSEGLLHFARNGMVARARRAVEHGVSPNVQNEQGETALLLAATNGQTEMVKFLLLHGANPAIPDLLGQTALVAAQGKGHGDIVDLFTRHGVTADTSLPRDSPRWQPDARRWVVACTALGATLVTLIAFLNTRRPISADQFLRLSQADQIQEAKSEWHVVVGMIKNPKHPEARGLSLHGGRFYVPRSEVTEVVGKIVYAIEKPQGITSYSGDDLPNDCWPGNWAVLWMLGWPMGVLTLPLLLVCGTRRRFLSLPI